MKRRWYQWLAVTRKNTMKTETQEIRCKHQGTFHYSERDQAQTQGAQRKCGISPLGDVSNPSGYGPALGGLTWTMVLDKVISKGPFQPQLLLFHEKIKLLQKLCLRWENHSKIGWRLTEGTCFLTLLIQVYMGHHLCPTPLAPYFWPPHHLHVHWSCSPEVLSVILSLHHGSGISVVSTSSTQCRDKTCRAFTPHQ